MVSRTVTARLHLETPASKIRGTAAQRSSRRRMIRYGLLAFNVLLLTTVGYFVLQSAGSSGGHSSSAAAGAFGNKDAAISDPLDRLSSADIAVNVARVANLPQAVAVTNQADSENAQLAVVQASDSLVAKPQVVATAFKSNKDIQVYTAKPGETPASIAAQFHVTTDSILWSNDLASNSVVAGQKLYIPPMNGIVYVVKDGDTADKLAEKYRSNKEKIIAANDAELTGLQVGTRIIIPDGQIVPAAPTYSSGGSSGYAAGFPWGGGPLYGGNGYIPGYCTWYVANRISVPSNWGNANTWDNLAPRSGWTVSTAPRAGAIAQTDRGSEGHVAIVEAVSEDGTQIKYSDMNGIAGYNRVGYSDWVSSSRFEHYIFR
jgi:surface antigen/LysM repeat protein